MQAVMHVEIRKNLQDRGLLFWMLILPILFTVLFIAVFTSGMDKDIQQQVTTSIVPGYIVMFVFFIMITMVNSFIKDRDYGMSARIASTPLSPFYYLIGKWIPYVMIVFIQIVILFVFGKIVYNIPLGQPMAIIVLSLFLAISVSGLGMALALFSNTENMGIAVTQVIALGGAMLGGLWIPFDQLPQFLQSASHFVPQYWAHLAFQEAMNGTLTFTVFFQAIGVLAIVCFISFIAARIQFPRFLRRAKS